MEKNRFTFEEIFEQNERRIHYHLHRLNIRDPHQEFYQEGLIAMWSAYRNYQPDKGPLSTYFNFIIRRRLIDLIRKESKRLEKEILASTEEEPSFEASLYQQASDTYSPELSVGRNIIKDETLWQHIRNSLTEKQWKWVQYYILEGMTLKEIARKEDVSVEAVKSWAKEAKKKLRHVDFEQLLKDSIHA